MVTDDGIRNCQIDDCVAANARASNRCFVPGKPATTYLYDRRDIIVPKVQASMSRSRYIVCDLAVIQRDITLALVYRRASTSLVPVKGRIFNSDVGIIMVDANGPTVACRTVPLKHTLVDGTGSFA